MYPRARPPAIIYIPPDVDIERWERGGYKHCRRRGYELIGLVHDLDGSKWPDVVRMMAAGEVEVVVIFRLSAMPEHRIPRLEEVGIENTGDVPRQRRARVFRQR